MPKKSARKKPASRAGSPEGRPASAEEQADEGEDSDASSGAGYHTSAEVTPARASPADEGSQAIQ
eukprot:SAG22_NODE_1021_length_5998_cov_2.167316_2_plen_65_part_00